jgi:hypothetical protein
MTSPPHPTHVWCLPQDGSSNGGAAPGEHWTYQAADGSWLFLLPLNVRMLLAARGSYAACPARLTARVLELEDVVQLDATRRRCAPICTCAAAGCWYHTCMLARARAFIVARAAKTWYLSCAVPPCHVQAAPTVALDLRWLAAVMV